MNKRVNKALAALMEQQKWVDDHGATREGYIDEYNRAVATSIRADARRSR